MNENQPTSATQTVTIRLDDDSRIALRIGTESRDGDSYYLGLNTHSPDHNCSAQTGLIRLLTAWIRSLCELKDGGLIYLPFDFSDEYTRWLACQRVSQEIMVVFGWAAVEGWAISPSDFSEYLYQVPEFSPDEPLEVQSFYLPWFISQIRRSRSGLSAAEPV